MPPESVRAGDLLWRPTQELQQKANITRYLRWLADQKDLQFQDYDALWQWSVTRLEDFWASLWEFFEVRASQPYTRVLEGRMPAARWFTDSELNYAEHVFRQRTSKHPALLFQSETRPLTEVSWDELYRQVASVAAALRGLGVRRGDRVVAFLPNIPETVVAFLATASLGAIWSSCSPDFGTRSVLDRFRQIEPKVLFAADGYSYGGKAFDRISAVAELQQGLGKLERTILVPYLHPGTDRKRFGGLRDVSLWPDLLGKEAELTFEQVPFSHPMWVVYSSGTTGLPKGLVHSQGGILLEFLKFLGLHMDLHPGDRFFWFSTTGWVMWNIVQGGLLTGATSVLYDGSPGYPDMDVLWKLAAEARLRVFGTSAAFLHACLQAGLKPGEKHDLGSLAAVGSTGSPLSPEGFQWAYRHVKADLWLASVSGGTDPCTGFLAACPLLPVHAGELQCRGLGVKAEAFDDDGRPLLDQVGELVITEPMPSMPLYLWNDPQNERYRESYFELYPGIWRHGDWIRITRRGSAVILGRSDSTLKRQGVRMGSSEIYSVVEDLPEIVDSLIVGFEAEGGYHMPLFVVLAEGLELDAALKEKIRRRIRQSLSPRHIPDDIYAVAEVPRTLNAKKLEVPVKKILMGFPVKKAVNVDSMSNPGALPRFLELRQEILGKQSA